MSTRRWNSAHLCDTGGRTSTTGQGTSGKIRFPQGILDAESEDLERVAGISSRSALLLRLIKESPLSTSSKGAGKKAGLLYHRAFGFLPDENGWEEDEEFCVIYLDAQNRSSSSKRSRKGSSIRPWCTRDRSWKAP